MKHAAWLVIAVGAVTAGSVLGGQRNRMIGTPTGAIADGKACGHTHGWFVAMEQTTTPGTRGRASTREHAALAVTMARARVTLIGLAAERWCLGEGHGRYPSSLAELIAYATGVRRLANQPRVMQCVLDSELTLDPWDSPIFFQAQENRLLVVSAGPDRVFTTSDDIALPDSALPNTVQLNPAEHCVR